jgi:ubiquinone/menaquinone biosynthesis C-methylase UbiE
MCNCNQSKPDTWYARLFARVYNPVMSGVEKKILFPKRKQLLSELSGTVLEVGAGTGINFPLYANDAKIIACEPSAAMLKYAENKIKTDSLENIELIHAGVGDDALLFAIPEGGFDAIVCTLVLCTIPDPEAALKDMQAWLKPGGQLIVLEHIKASGFIARSLQWFFNPIWKRLVEGCHLNRSTDKLLKTLDLTIEQEAYFSKVIPFYQAVLVKSDL